MENPKETECFKMIPEPSLRRLPIYYQYLKEQASLKKSEYISCTQIANDLHLIPIQVRKDIEAVGISGKPKIGYNISSMIEDIESFLGWNNVSDAFLVGAGHLGQALLGYQGFKDYGLNIVAAFDMDEKKIGNKIVNIKVVSIKKMSEMIKRMNIKIGIITVPALFAQEIADIMVNSGIKAIWNFAPAKIKVPSDIAVQHENLASSLAVLSNKLRTRR